MECREISYQPGTPFVTVTATVDTQFRPRESGTNSKTYSSQQLQS